MADSTSTPAQELIHPYNKTAARVRCLYKRRTEGLHKLLRKLEELHRPGANWAMLFSRKGPHLQEHAPLVLAKLAAAEGLAGQGCPYALEWLAETADLRFRVLDLHMRELPPVDWKRGMPALRNLNRAANGEPIQRPGEKSTDRLIAEHQAKRKRSTRLKQLDSEQRNRERTRGLPEGALAAEYIPLKAAAELTFDEAMAAAAVL